MPSYMIANNDMSKIPYFPPRAECFVYQTPYNLLSQLSMPSYLDADFGDLEEQDEWGL